jgi:hypothetical protein
MDKIIKRGKMFEGAENSQGTSGKPVEFEKRDDKYDLNEIYTKNKEK